MRGVERRPDRARVWRSVCRKADALRSGLGHGAVARRLFRVWTAWRLDWENAPQETFRLAGDCLRRVERLAASVKFGVDRTNFVR